MVLQDFDWYRREPTLFLVDAVIIVVPGCPCSACTQAAKERYASASGLPQVPHSMKEPPYQEQSVAAAFGRH